MPFRTRSLPFNNSWMKPLPRHGNACRIISLHAREWFIIQSFYHGLIHTAREHIDVASRGSFFALSIEEAHTLIEKMASNQNWYDECTPSHTCKVHQHEEVDMLTAKIDLMKKLENPCLDPVTCEECGETSHMGVNCPTVC
jgi:hypothetical protein